MATPRRPPTARGRADRPPEQVSEPLGGAAPARPAAPDDWRTLLAGASPREVLERIVDGDPLGLRARAAERLEQRALLLDADRVQLRAFARAARAALDYRGQPSFARWIGGVVDAALDDLLAEEGDSPGLSGEDPAEAATSGAFSDLARPLGLDPDALRRACAAFNRLDGPVRRAFFDLVLAGRSLDELARQSGRSAPELARAARTALEVLLAAGERQVNTQEMP